MLLSIASTKSRITPAVLSACSLISSAASTKIPQIPEEYGGQAL